MSNLLSDLSDVYYTHVKRHVGGKCQLRTELAGLAFALASPGKPLGGAGKSVI
jgi:hypothetical protein